MNKLRLSLLLLLAGSSIVWGADTKKDLSQARSDYRQAVSAHGPKSPEARQARQQLRSARATYHAERRERVRNRHSSHS
jgi:hypothetical protein